MFNVRLETLLPTEIVVPGRCSGPGWTAVFRPTVNHPAIIVAQDGKTLNVVKDARTVVRVPALIMTPDTDTERKLITHLLLQIACYAPIMPADSLKRLVAGLTLGLGFRGASALVASEGTATLLESIKMPEKITIYASPWIPGACVFALPAVDRGLRLVFEDARVGFVMFGPVAAGRLPIHPRTSWQRLGEEF